MVSNAFDLSKYIFNGVSLLSIVSINLSTADGMHLLRQMVGKRLEVQGIMSLGFVDLEKAFDTVPREMVMATLRWM